MASNTVTIAGVTFPNVPAVDLAVSGGGTARYTDVSDTTATASDVASGKMFYMADGVQTTGTASGGGGGLVYEEGTYKPTADANSSSISFANAHTERPFYVCIYDTTGDLASTDSVVYWEICSVVDLYGTFPVATNGSMYGHLKYFRKTSTNVTAANTSIGNESGINSNITSSGFKASTGSSYYFRANRTYKWIAVWKPTT